MATVTYSSVPKPPYDIHRNDYQAVNQNYPVTIGNDGLNMGSEESFYPLSLNEVLEPPFQPLPLHQPYFQPPQMGFAPTFPFNGVTYNGAFPPSLHPYNAVRHFRTQPSITSVPNQISGPSTSPQGGALTPCPVPLRKELQKPSKSKPRGKRVTRRPTQSANKHLLSIKPKRQRGPNKRPPGTAFSSLLDGLPDNVREALEEDYKGCCESVNIKDTSTKQKHMFSNRHCNNLPPEYQEHVPNFVCPAFVALKSSCRSKAGRYDSTDRHCKNCEAFCLINQNNGGAYPVVVTRSQYNLIQVYRTARVDSEGEKQVTDQSTEQADALIRLVLADVFRDGLPDWFPVINLGGETNDTGANTTDAAQLPTNTTPVVVPGASNSSFGQPQSREPYLFDPNSVNERADALNNGFPVINFGGETSDSGVIIMNNTVHLPTNNTSVVVSVPGDSSFVPPSLYDPSLFGPNSAVALKNGFQGINLEGGSNDRGAVMDASAQFSAISEPDPTANYLTQPRLYEPSLFDPNSAIECAEALKNRFPPINFEGQSSVAQSSMSLPDPVAQSEFFEPPLFDLEGVDEWDFLSGFL